MTPSRSRRGRPPARAALALGAFALVASCEAGRAPLAPPAAGPAPAPSPPGLSPVPPLPPATDARSAERAPGSGAERAPGSGAERAPGSGAERGPASGSERAPGSGAAIGAPQPLALPAFFGRLCDLRSGARAEHVRVAWLGDSHAAADLWTGAFRRRLQERYGNGGPGFLHLGWKARAPIRHDGVTFSTRSRWRLEPPAYSQTKRYDDGVLGLGGVRTLPLERDARARVEVSDPALRGETLRWTLSYRPLVASATADVVLGDGKQQRLLAEGGEAGPAGATTPAGATGKPGPAGATTPAGAAGKPGPAGSIAQTATPAGATTPAGLTTPGAAIGKGAPRQRTFRGPDAFEVRGGRGFQFFGVVAETEAPGLVVDTLGLNGARLSTMLAWDEPAWVSELARRRPDLVVVAFGTNESQEPAG
ncbi:MAG TPA: hypothetical protein VFS00_30100, partial [Polyangiaceae bacterium]|nr:hypothetical protein [Polyangiaceae bacterium]